MLVTSVFYVDNQEVEVGTKQASVYTSALSAVPGTMCIHQVITTKRREIMFNNVSFFCGSCDSADEKRATAMM